MSKKAIVSGLFVTILVSQIVGITGASADAYVTPWPSLYCSPAAQSVTNGEYVSFTAYNPNSSGQLTWTAVGGSPTNGYGTTFGTRFYIGSINETRLVSVTDGYQTSTCVLYVYNTGPTPTPSPVPQVYVSAQNALINSGENAVFTAWGGNGTYYWEAGTGAPVYGVGSSFTTRFYNDTNAIIYRNVLVRSGGTPAHGGSTVFVTVGVRPYITPTATPIPTARVELRTLGRNVTRGQSGENASVRARGGDTLDMIIRIRSTNSAYLSGVFVTDILPDGLSYIPRSTILNGYEMIDGITSSGIHVGTLSPNSETVLKFSVRVDGAHVPSWGTITVNNIAQMRADGLAVMAVQFSITMGQNLNIAAVSAVKTGPADALWLALLASLLMTGAYAAYTRTDAFGRRFALAQINRHVYAKLAPNFLR